MKPQLPFTETAPDGSTVEVFSMTDFASQCICTLPEGRVSQAVRHRTVDELWHVLEGSGEIDLDGKLIELQPGSELTIYCGTTFQFRSKENPLRILITTLPAWPGEDEAELMDTTRWLTNQ